MWVWTDMLPISLCSELSAPQTPLMWKPYNRIRVVPSSAANKTCSEQDELA